MSVHYGFTIEIYGFTYPAARVPSFLCLCSCWKTLRRIDDDGRPENKCRDTENS